MASVVSIHREVVTFGGRDQPAFAGNLHAGDSRCSSSAAWMRKPFVVVWFDRIKLTTISRFEQ